MKKANTSSKELQILLTVSKTWAEWESVRWVQPCECKGQTWTTRDDTGSPDDVVTHPGVSVCATIHYPYAEEVADIIECEDCGAVATRDDAWMPPGHEAWRIPGKKVPKGGRV